MDGLPLLTNLQQDEFFDFAVPTDEPLPTIDDSQNRNAEHTHKKKRKAINKAKRKVVSKLKEGKTKRKVDQVDGGELESLTTTEKPKSDVKIEEKEQKVKRKLKTKQPKKKKAERTAKGTAKQATEDADQSKQPFADYIKNIPGATPALLFPLSESSESSNSKSKTQRDRNSREKQRRSYIKDNQTILYNLVRALASSCNGESIQEFKLSGTHGIPYLQSLIGLLEHQSTRVEATFNLLFRGPLIGQQQVATPLSKTRTFCTEESHELKGLATSDEKLKDRTFAGRLGNFEHLYLLEMVIQQSAAAAGGEKQEDENWIQWLRKSDEQIATEVQEFIRETYAKEKELPPPPSSQQSKKTTKIFQREQRTTPDIWRQWLGSICQKFQRDIAKRFRYYLASKIGYTRAKANCNVKKIKQNWQISSTEEYLEGMLLYIWVPYDYKLENTSPFIWQTAESSLTSVTIAIRKAMEHQQEKEEKQEKEKEKKKEKQAQQERRGDGNPDPKRVGKHKRRKGEIEQKQQKEKELELELEAKIVDAIAATTVPYLGQFIRTALFVEFGCFMTLKYSQMNFYQQEVSQKVLTIAPKSISQAEVLANAATMIKQNFGKEERGKQLRRLINPEKLELDLDFATTEFPLSPSSLGFLT